MRLLNPQTVKTQSKAQSDFKLKQSLLLDEEIAKKTKQLNELVVTFENRKSAIDSAMADSLKEVEERKKLLEIRVDALEERLFEGMKPLAEKEEYLKNWETVLQLRESTNQDSLLQISVRETDLSERENRLRILSADVARRQADADNSVLLAQKEMKLLDDKKQIISRESERFDVKVKERELEHFEKDRELSQREKILQIGREQLDSNKKKLEQEKAALASRRLELEAAFEELKARK